MAAAWSTWREEPNISSHSDPLPKSHKHEPQRPAFPQFSPQEITSMKCTYPFTHKLRILLSPFPSLSLVSPSPSNILVTSSHKGAPSLAFFGWRSFTQVPASVGRVMRSCCSMTTPPTPDWACPLPGRKTARASPETLHRRVVSSEHNLLPLGLWRVPVAPEAGGS